MQTVPIADGSTLHITRDVPSDATGRRAAAMPGQIYVIAGRVDDPNTGYHGGYLGQTADLASGARPSTSFANWVIAQRRICPTAMGVLHAAEPYTPDYLRYIEARLLADLSLRGLWMLNTHTSAGTCSRRLTRTQVKEGQQLAENLSHAIFSHVFDGQTNPWPSPSSNRREAAVRVVWQADRALSTEEVLAGMAAAGVHPGNARTPGFSTRRDLRRRESLEGTRGTPRVYTTKLRGRRVLYYRPTLSRSHAVAGYLAAHRPPTKKRRASPNP